MRARFAMVFMVLATSAGVVPPAIAQTDYRNLDRGRPVRTEDAYPVERYAFELLLPYEYTRTVMATRTHLLRPELAYGLRPNIEVSLDVAFAWHRASDVSWGDIAGLGLAALYNFNTDAPSLPALSFRVDAELPVGGFAGDGVRFGVMGIATRSWGRTRGHLNGSFGFGGEEQGASGIGESAPDWSVSLAVDRTLWRHSMLLLGELVAQHDPGDGPNEVTAGIGFRWQAFPTLVVDAGARRRLSRHVGPDLGLTVGVSHTFAIAGLMPRGASRMR